MIQFIGEIGSVTTSRRQLDALELLSKNTTLHNLLMHRDDVDKQQVQQALLARNNQKSLWDPSCTWNWSSPNARRLNDMQLAAVEMAMKNRVSLIQGPPGTGKTHTIAVLLHTYVNYFNAHDGRVLAAAPSNLATQLLAKKFVEIGEFGAKVSPICVLQCDESRHEKGSQEFNLTKGEVTSERDIFVRFSTAVLESTNLASIHSTIKSKRAFLVGPEDEAMLKKNCPPHHFPQLRSNKRQDSWVDFVNSCFRMLEKAARVFFTTCSGAANLQSKGLSFSLVVVDEAGKATQPDSFVATSILTDVTDATRVVLVGDHKQLRPQLATKGYENTSFGESLMERLDDFRFPLTMLEVQFRMHPNIRHVVSSLTYGGKLKDDPERVTARPIPFCCTSLIAQENLRDHVAFIDCNGREEKERHGTSFINHAESEVVFRLLEQLVHAEGTTIAVLSPYNGQVRRMREHFKQRAPSSNAKVTFCSVDASQGKEYDIVVLSLVRSSASLGFLKDERRFNVAISRAQHLLIVVGNKQSVIKAPMIEDFIALLSDEPQKVKRGPVKRPRSA
ncbi:Hypothetical protein, putative [Bodo saltans]|uniref:Uncharacterized protein n=1 Tax=Bodo saltans TaxID=75058 RepID=A0A0S4JRY1_BODSA|nr:Hypothetical protein, putative [Bodo saltans]|eukprot:CUG92083.1 Hypothetical protein, putative [Bodo saltans]